MKHLNKIFIVAFVSLFFYVPAYALDLSDAKSAGLVGEMENGYLGSPQASPSAEVKLLIKDINQKRKQHYQKIASSQKLPLKTVEALAGEKAQQKTAKGHYVKGPSGWAKK